MCLKRYCLLFITGCMTSINTLTFCAGDMFIYHEIQVKCCLVPFVCRPVNRNCHKKNALKSIMRYFQNICIEIYTHHSPLTSKLAPARINTCMFG